MALALAATRGSHLPNSVILVRIGTVDPGRITMSNPPDQPRLAAVRRAIRPAGLAAKTPAFLRWAGPVTPGRGW